MKFRWMFCCAVVLSLLADEARCPAGAGAQIQSISEMPPSEARVDEILNNTANILWDFSDHYFHQGDYGQAVRIDHLVERLAPDFKEPYGVAAWLEWSEGVPSMAVEDLERGINHNPGEYDLYAEMGNCYQYWLKRPSLAMPYYIRATSFYGEAPWSVFESLGHTAEKIGDYSRAAVAYRTARLKAQGSSEIGPAEANLRRIASKIRALGNQSH